MWGNAVWRTLEKGGRLKKSSLPNSGEIVLSETRIENSLCVRNGSGCRRFVLTLIIVTGTVFVKYGTVQILKS
jgi:hypothetical protein